MSSSISSSDWRRFFRLAAGTAALVAGIVYAFVVLVDPFDTLPLSPPAQRVPVATNARFAFPSLARSPRFDSAVFGTSTSRLLRPVVLNAEFGARFANLSMNDATVNEQSLLLSVFARSHPKARFVLQGLDIRTCAIGDSYQMFTPRPFPAWMYGDNPWRGYAEMFNLYAVQEAGQLFGVLIGIKREVYGSDGYTNFLPPEGAYDSARVAAHLRSEPVMNPPGEHSGDPGAWRFPAIERVEADLKEFPPETHKLLYFVPYNHTLQPPTGSPGAQAWDECKRRIAAVARLVPNTVAVDFLVASPITDVDDNYWDGQHYRVPIADRIAKDLFAAFSGGASPDYRVLATNRSAEPSRKRE